MALLVILLCLAVAVTLMVVLGEKHLRPMSPERQRALQRWLLPLIGLSLVLSLLQHYVFAAA